MKAGVDIRSAARNAEGKAAVAVVGAVLMAATLTLASKDFGRSLLQRSEPKAR